MSTSLLHSTNAREQDRSKEKCIVNVLDKNRSLGMSGDVTPSMPTTKDQQTASVTLVYDTRLDITPMQGNVTDPKEKPCCYTKDSIVRRINMLQSTHEKLVADHFILKFHSMNSLAEFGKSIIVGLEAVSDFGNANVRGNRAASQDKSDTQCIPLDDGLVLTEDDIRTIDATVELKLEELGSNSHEAGKGVTIISKTRRSSNQNQVSSEKCPSGPDYGSPIDILDGDMVFSEEDFKNIDESGDYGIFVVKYADYIFMKKINKMPNDFDIGLARHNMTVQLFKYSMEKPDIRLSGISK
ncbi:hypothetical protein Fot_15586 [Forsythia ovata]|uniref:Uncharacterized protein n=1 Tax=Forsythia ovata TaxID=205694 RepID=A0ABD1WBZ5_9LAMI